MAESRLVTFDELKARFGLTVTARWLRELAANGHFPKSDGKGKWDADATIRGLLKYYQTLQGEAADLKEAIDGEKHRKLKRENDIQDGLLLSRAEVVEAFRKVVEPVKNTINQKLVNELPVAVAGFDVAQVRIVSRRIGDELMREWQTLFSKFGQ